MSAPFRFATDGAHPLRVTEAVYQAVGAASMCWENVDQAGVFDTDQAAAIAEALLDLIHERCGPEAPDPVPGIPDSDELEVLE